MGGATKLYGAALYRLRPQDFGNTSTSTASRLPGRSTTMTWSPITPRRRALPGPRRARRRTHRGRGSKQYRLPAVSHEPGIQELADDLTKAGYIPSTRPAASCSTRRTAHEYVHSLHVVRWFPCLVTRKPMPRRFRSPRDRASERHALTGAEAEDSRRSLRPKVNGVVVERDGNGNLQG